MTNTVKDMPTIGGSEISIVMGLNRWKTPLRLWAEKTGKFQTESKDGLEYIELGNELEDFVARKFSRKTGLPVRRDTRTFRYKKYPYMIAHPDRRITGTDELLECKTCSAWKAHEWEGEEIPQEYILQVNWYLGILEMSKGWIAVLIGGQRFIIKELPFDGELFAKQVDAARNFVEYFLAQEVPPMAMSDDSSTLMRLYPQATGDLIYSEDAELINWLKNLERTKEQINNLDVVKQEIEARIKQRMGEHEGIETPGYKVTWKNQGRKQIDYGKLKADGLYDKYLVENETRVMRVYKNKEKANGNNQ